MNEDKKFTLDRSIFSNTTIHAADDHVSEWKNKTLSERMEAAFYLINKTFGTTNQTPLDRNVFSCRKHPL